MQGVLACVRYQGSAAHAASVLRDRSQVEVNTGQLPGSALSPEWDGAGPWKGTKTVNPYKKLVDTRSMYTIGGLEFLAPNRMGTPVCLIADYCIIVTDNGFDALLEPATCFPVGAGLGSRY